ncbi:DNA polymerase III subunit epsilon, partial [Lactobacillus delbrueckii subsp. lactis]
MDPKLHDYTVFDLETTGKKIIQIGALKVRDDQTVAKFSTYVNPLEKINDYVSHLTGISNYQTDAAPLIDEVMPDFLDFVGDDTLVGHNILSFYCNVLADNGYPVANPKLDTLLLANSYKKRGLFADPIPNVRLSTLKDYYGININSHIAISDCITNNIVYQKLRDGDLAKATEIIDFTPKQVDSRLAGQRFVITGQF